MSAWDDEAPPAAGVVLEAGRGSLPFRLIPGESLGAASAGAAGEAGIELVDATAPLAAVAERGEVLVVHDALCPMTPPAFLAACAARSADDDVVVVGVRAVTDTVKLLAPARGEADGPVLGATVDRDALVAVWSPVVVPPDVLADLAASAGDGPTLPALDLAELTAALRARYGAERVVLVDAPPEARRVGGLDDIELLEALTRPGDG
ncbi:2-C-methyl-D-erythritol 4-phosphate cytidylyltransferase [Nocardioides sp.]|uniref:2-C-methyl-D-erythritol 4-phosphate cytidylyltransferase n=1 Tax=Nocardioides sp. TaxID=35761 RepID=UPI003518530C